jgi:hypothetical protein
VCYTDITPNEREKMNPNYESSDDGYDAAKDAYCEGWGAPVTASQRREYEAEMREQREARRGW